MPKFCTQCGSPLSEDAAFCNSCGAKVAGTEETTVENTPITEEVTEVVEVETITTAEETTIEAEATETAETAPESANENTVEETPAVQQPTEDSTPLDKGIAFAKDKVGDKYEAFKTSPNRDKYIGFAAIGVVAIVVICVVLSLVLGGGYKGAVKAYMKSNTEGGYDNYVDTLPDIIHEAIIESEYDGDEDEMEEDYDDEWKQISGLIADIDYDILDAEKFDKDQLDGLEESLQDKYEEYVDDDIKVSKAYEVKVKITAELKTDDDNKKSSKQYLIVAKVNGDWGVVDESSSSMIDDYE